MTDRIQTVSQRSKPSSRSFLIGEQPNPWFLLQNQDKKSRHRGPKHYRRWELLDSIRLLSLEYLWSVKQKSILTEYLDHFGLQNSTCLKYSSYSQANFYQYTNKKTLNFFQFTLYTSLLLFRRIPPQ